jgi:hypothetical protein
MTARGPIAHGGPQRPPRTPLRRSPRHCAAHGVPPWTPWTIRSRLDRPHHAHATYAYVGGVERRDHHAGLLPPVITITGIGDHLQPEWLITFTGMRSRRRARSKSTRWVETPPIQASRITVTSAFPAVLRGPRKGGKYELWCSLGIRSWSEC